MKGKVNTIMLDGCSKVGLVFSSVLATVEAVNCQSCQIQCEATCPTLSIDKTDGAKVRRYASLCSCLAPCLRVLLPKCSVFLMLHHVPQSTAPVQPPAFGAELT